MPFFLSTIVSNFFVEMILRQKHRAWPTQPVCLMCLKARRVVYDESDPKCIIDLPQATYRQSVMVQRLVSPYTTHSTNLSTHMVSLSANLRPSNRANSARRSNSGGNSSTRRGRR